MQLKEFTIRKAKPKKKPYRLSDGGSLFLLVKPNGSKLWQLRYRFRRKENILSFGPYPLVTIAEHNAFAGRSALETRPALNSISLLNGR